MSGGGYQTDQAEKLKLGSNLSVQYSEDAVLVQDALDNAEIAKQQEADAKKKRKLYGSIIGVVGTLLLPGSASLWQLALGAAVGGQAGEWGYEQWEWFAGSKQNEMERTMDLIDSLREDVRFSDLQEDLRVQNVINRDYNRRFTDETGWNAVFDIGSDFLRYMSWGELLGLSGATKASSLWDAFKEVFKKGAKSQGYQQGADLLKNYSYSYNQPTSLG